MSENFNFNDEKSVSEDNVLSDLDDILNLNEADASSVGIDLDYLSGEADAKQIQEDSGLDFFKGDVDLDIGTGLPPSEESKETDFNSEWDFLSGSEAETASSVEEREKAEEAKELTEDVPVDILNDVISSDEAEPISEIAELEAPDNRGFFENSEELISEVEEDDNPVSPEVQAEASLSGLTEDSFSEVSGEDNANPDEESGLISTEAEPSFVDDVTDDNPLNENGPETVSEVVDDFDELTATEATYGVETSENMAFFEPDASPSPFSDVENEQNQENTVAPIEESVVALEKDNAPEYQEYSDVLGQEALNTAESEDNPNYVKWYSGSSYDEYFEVSKTSESTTLQGDAYRHSIHINVGYDTYGWQVQFDNQIVMNLRDVREYQLRNGKLPSENGVILYGGMRTEFQSIDRIVVYESVQYFSYGV